MDNPAIKPKHGGARPGAGRHTADGAHGLKNTMVMLNYEHIALARKLGDGNLSLGVRRALGQAAMKKSPEKSTPTETL